MANINSVFVSIKVNGEEASCMITKDQEASVVVEKGDICAIEFNDPSLILTFAHIFHSNKLYRICPANELKTLWKAYVTVEQGPIDIVLRTKKGEKLHIVKCISATEFLQLAPSELDNTDDKYCEQVDFPEHDGENVETDCSDIDEEGFLRDEWVREVLTLNDVIDSCGNNRMAYNETDPGMASVRQFLRMVEQEHGVPCNNSAQDLKDMIREAVLTS